MTKRTKDRSLLLGVLALLAIVMVVCSQSFAAEVTAAWVPSEGAAGYKVSVCDRHINMNFPCDVTDVGQVTTAPVQLELGAAVYVCVTAYNSAGESPPSCRYVASIENLAVDNIYRQTNLGLAGLSIHILSNYPAFGNIQTPGRRVLPQYVNELVRRLDELP